MQRSQPAEHRAVAPEMLIGEFVAKWPNSLRSPPKPGEARRFDGQPRKIEKAPQESFAAQALEPSALASSVPGHDSPEPPGAPSRRRSLGASLPAQDSPLSAALERARTVKATHQPPAVRAARQAQQAHPHPASPAGQIGAAGPEDHAGEGAGTVPAAPGQASPVPAPPLPGARVDGFDPAPSTHLPSGLQVPAGRAQVGQEGRQGPLQAQVHAGEVIAQAGRNAERARAEARVDVRRCGFLRQAMTRLPSVLLAAFDLACALVVTLATCLYANQVLAVACRNFKQAVLGPVSRGAGGAHGMPNGQAIGQAAATDPAEPVANDFRPRPDASGVAGPSPAHQRRTQQVERLVERLQAARRNMKRAGDEAHTVAATKASFVRRALILGTGAIGLGIAVAVTVLSGGATLAIPGLVLATVLVRNFVANAQCAWTNRQRALAGQPLLPMGNNALNNALYRHYVEEKQYPDGLARLEASKVGGSVSLLIGLAQFGSMLSSLLVGSAVVQAVKWVADSLKGGRLGATFTRASLNAYELARARDARDDQQARREEVTDQSRQAWRQFLEELHAENAEDRPLSELADQRTVDERLDSLSRMLAVWSVSGPKLDDLPEFMSREGWLNGDPTLGDGAVLPGDDALSQAARLQKDLLRRQQSGAYIDATLLTTISWSVANGAQTLKLFIETFVES